MPADFETRLDPAAAQRIQTFIYPEDDPKASISFVSDCSHSGTRALRLRADGADEPLRLTPTLGCCFHVTAGRRHRFSAWIKTALDAGEVTLTATEYLFNCSQVTVLHRSLPLQGRNEWRQIAVDFVPGEKAHVVDVALEVRGRGMVWTDDWLFDEYPEDEHK